MANTALLKLLQGATKAPLSKTGETLKKYGVEVPEAQQESTLSKVLNALRTGEYAVGGLLAGRGISAGIKQKISPSTVLGVKNPVAKLATDILLDPTTYLTFGFGGGAKLATKAGAQVILSRAGTKTLKSLTKKVGEKQARNTVANMLAEGGKQAEKKLLAKGGLKLAGQQILPRAVVTKPLKGLDTLIGKAPVAGKGYVAGKGVLEKAFKPFAEIERLPAEFGGKGIYATGKFKPFVKGTQAEITKAVEPIIAARKGAEEAIKKPWWQTIFKPKSDVGGEVAEAIEKGVSENQVISDLAKWMSSEHKIMLQGEQARGIAKAELPNYLRHFLTDKARTYLDAGGSLYAGLSRPLRVKLGSAQPRKIAGTIKEINEALRDKVGGDFFEPDAFKAFAQRKVEHIKAVNTYDFLDDIKKSLGQPGTGSKVIGGINHVESTAPQLKGVLLPAPIVKHIDETTQALKSDEVANSFLKVYDKALAFWKGTVTGYFPAFHTRNFMGGTFNNWLAGVKNPARYFQSEDILRGKDKTYTSTLGTKFTGNQLLDEAKQLGAIDQVGMIDVMRQIEKEVGQSQMRKLGNYPKVLMQTVENRLRMPLFLDRRLKGDTAQEATEWVFKFHFDYAPEGLTSFEKNWMKRFIPFYRWTRGNVPLQLEQMLKQPGKYAGIEKTRQAISGEKGQEEFQYLPEWMREQLTFRIGETGGQSLWMQLDLPLEDIAKLPINKSGMREMVGMLSPFLKFPIETYTNQNLYFGSEIVNPDLPPEMQTEKAISQLKALPEPMKKFLNFKEVKRRDYTAEKATKGTKKIFKTQYEMDAKKLHFIKSAFGRFYMTIGQAFDPEFTEWMRASRLLGGIPIRPVDIEEQKDWRTWEQEQKERETLQQLKQQEIIPYAGQTIPKNRGLEALLKK